MQSGAVIASFTVAVGHRTKSNGRWQNVNDGLFCCSACHGCGERGADPDERDARAGVRQADSLLVAGGRR
jgi:hypothetical protein